jgi:transcription-repair coupling factor (superfamily II helicase)
VVETIYNKAGELEKRFPNAVIGVGHGKCPRMNWRRSGSRWSKGR